MPTTPLPAASPLERLEAEFLRPYRVQLSLGAIGLLAQSLLLLPIAPIQGRVLDRLVGLAARGGPAGIAESDEATRVILAGLSVSAACIIARALLAWRVSAMMGRIAQEVVVALRGGLNRKLLRLPMAYFDAQQTGKLMARVTSDVGSVLTFINSGSLQLINDLILAAGIAVVLAWLEWRLALVALVVVPLYALNHRAFSRRIRRLSSEIRSQIAVLYALLSERVSAVRIVKSFAKEEAELSALDERIDAHRSMSWQNSRAAASLGALATLISGLGTVLVVGYGALLVGRGDLSFGQLMAFYALIGQLYGPIVRLTQFSASATATRISIERLFEVFDEPEPIADRPGALPLDATFGAICFRDVRFCYAPDSPAAIDGLNLEIRPGETVSILGASGSGKSTLLALILRLYDLTEGCGALLVDGTDVRDLRLGDLRRRFALVPQRAMLFEGTIRSNLLYACPEASESRMRRALEVADLAATIDAMPLGLDTPVGERGLSLSGGQRQRLALARAVVADPSVLLLDDCTSALDAETEARVQVALAEARPGRTTLIVSHKVASFRRADRILILEGGRVVEQGSHDDLISLGGRYAETFSRQTRSLAA
ncbi:ABC transporter ATP-binding protein [Tautonia plasticadhaerens]|uniref:Multidrug export ATP-binding/permease protein n=1 Tax=Tautonia plasticadhaerens TaxID=2527974 RepID=A0A518H602_9BACT|nr:ABC transporter ATP-binding protein [Tautonia plasticadhaerens]QDV36262.1 Putative multidrug export ATP-binding/permease protein [Tautonia plasticadhaerens]